MSDKGISTSIFRESGCAENQEIYLNESIKKKNISFIENIIQMANIYFSPISQHQIMPKQLFTILMNKVQFNFVKKEYNPANLPEICKAKNLNQLRNRIKYCLGKLDSNIVYSFLDQHGADLIIFT